MIASSAESPVLVDTKKDFQDGRDIEGVRNRNPFTAAP